MAKLKWNELGNRYFETGVENGVLYVNNSGVAWNGLISVTESPSGGVPEAKYLDGVKYLNYTLSEEFEGTISAFTFPDEFAECDGSLIYAGISVHQQDRKPFGLSYRTRVGDGIEGAERGYKLHLVYNVLASPSDKEYVTINESVDPLNFEWAFTTIPNVIEGGRPSAHLSIDSTKTYNSLLSKIDTIVYGTSNTAPRLPNFSELKELTDLYSLVGYGQGSYGEVPYGGITKIGI